MRTFSIMFCSKTNKSHFKRLLVIKAVYIDVKTNEVDDRISVPRCMDGHNDIVLTILERLLNRTKVISLANHKGHKQRREPIKTLSKYL